MFNLFSLFVAQMSFVLIDDAKLRRFSAHSKLFRSFFIKSIGQGPRLWTNRRNDVDYCPKEGFMEMKNERIWGCCSLICSPKMRIGN